MTGTTGEEAHPAGLVAAIFGDIRRRMPFVPALFRALAADPGALETAWLQARALYDDPRASETAVRLRDVARSGLDYRPAAAVRAAVGPFLGELPALLLVVTSLALTLDRRLPRRPRPPGALPEPDPLAPPPVPELAEEHPLYGEIRAVYGTQHVPVLYRSLAAQGLLEEPWRAIGPFLASERGHALAGAVSAAAEAEALRFPDYAWFGSESGRPILGELRRALPRNLIFALAATCPSARVRRGK